MGGERKKKQGYRESDTNVFLEIPRLVVKRADGARREPPADTVEMEGVIADAPRDRAVGRDGRVRIGLALDACNGNARKRTRRRDTRKKYHGKHLNKKDDTTFFAHQLVGGWVKHTGDGKKQDKNARDNVQSSMILLRQIAQVSTCTSAEQEEKYENQAE